MEWKEIATPIFFISPKFKDYSQNDIPIYNETFIFTIKAHYVPLLIIKRFKEKKSKDNKDYKYLH